MAVITPNCLEKITLRFCFSRSKTISFFSLQFISSSCRSVAGTIAFAFLRVGERLGTRQSVDIPRNQQKLWNVRTNMADAYEGVSRGSLKLKGVADGGVKK